MATTKKTTTAKTNAAKKKVKEVVEQEVPVNELDTTVGAEPVVETTTKKTTAKKKTAATKTNNSKATKTTNAKKKVEETSVVDEFLDTVVGETFTAEKSTKKETKKKTTTRKTTAKKKNENIDNTIIASDDKNEVTEDSKKDEVIDYEKIVYDELNKEVKKTADDVFKNNLINSFGGNVGNTLFDVLSNQEDDKPLEKENPKNVLVGSFGSIVSKYADKKVNRAYFGDASPLSINLECTKTPKPDTEEKPQVVENIEEETVDVYIDENNSSKFKQLFDKIAELASGSTNQKPQVTEPKKVETPKQENRKPVNQLSIVYVNSAMGANYD